MDLGKIVCPYCGAEVPRTRRGQFTCGRQKCRTARCNEQKKMRDESFKPDTDFTALGVEILVDLTERKKLDARAAADVMNRTYGAVADKLKELKETGAYSAVWKRIQMMRRLGGLL